MPLSLAEAQSALTTALNMWLDQNPRGFQVNVGGQPVNIIYSRNGNRLDFGFPNLYPMSQANVASLTNWWTAQHTGARVLPPQMEPGSGLYKINAVIYPVSPQGVTLNFHIPLTD